MVRSLRGAQHNINFKMHKNAFFPKEISGKSGYETGRNRHLGTKINLILRYFQYSYPCHYRYSRTKNLQDRDHNDHVIAGTCRYYIPADRSQALTTIAVGTFIIILAFHAGSEECKCKIKFVCTLTVSQTGTRGA